jgi:hypothetical protein
MLNVWERRKEVALIEERWREEGPDWSDPVECLAYSDWLEEQGWGRAAEACRYLVREKRKPHKMSQFGDLWSWALPDATQKDSFPETVRLPEGMIVRQSPWRGWHDSKTEHEAYMNVITHNVRQEMLGDRREV